MDETEEIFDVVLPARYQAAEGLHPGKQPLDFPASAVAAELTAILSVRRAGRRIGSTNSHCSSVNSQRPAIPVCGAAQTTSSFPQFRNSNVYEMGSTLI